MRTLALRTAVAVAISAALIVSPASATPVCTDGYAGGPPASECGGRIFPESNLAQAYIQYTPQPITGFREYEDGLMYMAQKYPRWISVFKLSDLYGKNAVSAGPDVKRPGEQGDTGDGRSILVVKITDHTVPDKGKQNLFFSLSVHGNERGGLEGGVRTAEDLAIAADSDPAAAPIPDGIDNYQSSTGRKPIFHAYDARELLAKEAVYLIDFNIDGWAVGDWWATPPLPYTRGNSFGTDLNRQMPTIGRINPSRNPLEESEMKYGYELMHKVASEGVGGKLATGMDLHGELNSQAFVDIMYPAGQFDSVQHRRLISIAERTKSVIDATLFGGAVDATEEAQGGNDAEGAQDGVPTKPAHWGNVWDTLGYTDTGYIGDYLATDLAVTGMDYEFAFNHTVPDKVWNVATQENLINGARAVIKTAMAYTLTQEKEFSADNVRIETKGRPGYVVNPVTVTDTDADGPGVLAGPNKNGVGANNKPVTQAHYEVTNQRWLTSEDRLLTQHFVPLRAADIAADPATLDLVDTLVLADNPAPADAKGRAYDTGAYYANLKAWVQRGGNLVLTDHALHALETLGVVPAGAVTDINVYQPYANVTDLTHPLAKGLRANARQLVEAAILGYSIGDDASPMSVVKADAFAAAGGKTVGTTGDGAGSSDDGSQVSVGEVKVGSGDIRIIGGALPTPTEQNDHRYGLRDFAPTFAGTIFLENALASDAPGLGEKPLPADLQPGPGAAKKPRKCLAARRYRFHVPPKAGKRGFKVFVNGKRVKVRKRTVTVKLKRYRGKKLTFTVKRGKRTVAVLRYKVCGSI